MIIVVAEVPGHHHDWRQLLRSLACGSGSKWHLSGSSYWVPGFRCHGMMGCAGCWWDPAFQCTSERPKRILRRWLPGRQCATFSPTYVWNWSSWRTARAPQRLPHQTHGFCNGFPVTVSFKWWWNSGYPPDFSDVSKVSTQNGAARI